MIYYFYLTRNIIGLILILSPLAGFLYIDSYFIFSMIAVCAVSALVPLRLRRQMHTSGKALLMAAVWTGVLVSGACFAAIAERNTYAAFLTAVISVFTGFFVFMEKPVLEIDFSCSFAVSRRGRSLAKIIFFCGLLSFAGASSFLAMPHEVVVDFFMEPEAVFTAGLLVGPAVAALFSDNKGVYSGCIFMIFLAEIAAAGAAGGENALFFLYLGHFASGLFMSGLLVIFPLLVFYLSDAGAFPVRLLAGSLAACCGSVLAFLVMKAGIQFTPIVFILLIFAFFVLFSAWKHRFFLLKSRRL